MEELGEEKECPECAELVKKKAQICRFCNFSFAEAASGGETAQQQASVPSSKAVPRWQVIAIVASLVLAYPAFLLIKNTISSALVFSLSKKTEAPPSAPEPAKPVTRSFKPILTIDDFEHSQYYESRLWARVLNWKYDFPVYVDKLEKLTIALQVDSSGKITASKIVALEKEPTQIHKRALVEFLTDMIEGDGAFKQDGQVEKLAKQLSDKGLSTQSVEVNGLSIAVIPSPSTGGIGGFAVETKNAKPWEMKSAFTSQPTPTAQTVQDKELSDTPVVPDLEILNEISSVKEAIRVKQAAGESKEVVSLYSKLIQLLKKTGDKEALAEATRNQKELISRISEEEKVTKEKARLTLVYDKIRNLAVQGQQAYLAADYVNAESLYRQAATETKKLGNQNMAAAHYLCCAGTALMGQKRYPEAVESLQEAKAIASTIPPPASSFYISLFPDSDKDRQILQGTIADRLEKASAKLK